MRIDPELDALADGLPTFDFSDVRTARETFAGLVTEAEPSATMMVRDDIAKAGRNSEVPVRLYYGAKRDGPHPCLIYLHGGGFVLGGLDSEDAAAREIAQDVGCVVVSVDYRLAPEHPFPAALDDLRTVLDWVVERREDLKIDPSRIAVGGESAGACLAAAATLRARDEGGPAICFQYLGIPPLDDRLQSGSMTTLAFAPGWTRTNATWSWRHYLGGHSPDDSGYAVPARARSLRNLPPAYVAICEIDPLRDEGLEYARRLLASGVSTELVVYPGTFHGSSLIAPSAWVSRRMHRTKVEALRRGMGVDPDIADDERNVGEGVYDSSGISGEGASA
ncbi:alpha/beta hydrolase [Sinosporangium siamense]|uniref:Esterase n=1 Tax=Sinosporangium siamense TaxID=1367973 RepID=A0A919V5D9_9ACTN|nr:alpha/beta hydrolase [Sinosporangium siamense]GII92910.1 esterase [Sinosporangium siamense]